MADGLFPELKFHHVGFSVSNLESAIAFYGEVFGMEVEKRVEIPAIHTKLAFLRRGPLRFEVFEKAGSAPVPAHSAEPNSDLTVQGTKHPCFSVTDCQAALERLSARSDLRIVGILREVGKPMVVESDVRAIDGRAPARAFFLRDPCGILVEILQADQFPE